MVVAAVDGGDCDEGLAGLEPLGQALSAGAVVFHACC